MNIRNESGKTEKRNRKGKNRKGEKRNHESVINNGSAKTTERNQEVGNLKTRESIQDKEDGEGEIKRDDESCRATVGRGGDRYRTRQGLTRRAAVRDERHTSTQANCTDDIIKKNDGHQVKAKQSSTTRVTCLKCNHRRLAICAPRVSRSRAP